MCRIGKSIEAKRLVVPRDGVGTGIGGWYLEGLGVIKMF